MAPIKNHLARSAAALLPTFFPLAANAQESAAPAALSLLPRDLSPWGMFIHADILVKAVMIGLAFASLVTWTVWLVKTLELRKAKRDAAHAVRVLNQSRTLAEADKQLGSEGGGVTKLLQAVTAEIRLSVDAHGEALKERTAWQLERIEASLSRQMSRGTGVLATIGATAPFVGLFGTVWGIMNSFIGISLAHTTNLAVVAPGIAEALLATALGLFAAIPAVVIYNVFSRGIRDYRALIGDAVAAIMRLVSRDLERGKLRLPRAAE
ncbi:MAG TPA: tonB-system energizer ExbB [Xanthobacteraceae bacterium]|nr:tonB-system energizer ExbB [Xanthobacteraceae bacterium]